MTSLALENEALLELFVNCREADFDWKNYREWRGKFRQGETIVWQTLCHLDPSQRDGCWVRFKVTHVEPSLAYERGQFIRWETIDWEPADLCVFPEFQGKRE